MQPETEANFACRLCAGTDLRLYHAMGNDAQYRYYQCRHCKLVNYDLATGLGQEQFTVLDKDPTDDSDPWNLQKDQSFAFVQRFLPEPGSMLDIGSGSGRLMYVARRAGWRVKGLELSQEMADFVKAKLGEAVVVADFLEVEPAEISDSAFDLVSLRHVLEHLPDCLLAMRKLRALLVPEGHVLIEIPNVESVSKKVKRFLSNSGLRKPRYPDDLVIGHANEFCRTSFGYLLRETGFSLVRWETYSKKPLSNFIYNHLHIGSSARALIRAEPDH
ncbi:MAG TPA: class I SAM-dependent methyltransferase [Gammaproteobacteria bacterium]